ncbi:MAG: response regulator [Clostridiales bacterium]|nr:response regulator [Clostridiales bacterium]
MSKKIMIVDDATFMRLMIKDILVKNSYEIAAEANDGLEAVEKYKETRPDAVILDITMPNMDGLTTLVEIKKHDPDAKVIICSAMGQESIVIEAIKAGASDFIVKPFHADRILKALQKTVGL